MMPFHGEVRYEAKLGESAYGPQFAAPVTPERAAIDERQKLVRLASGAEAISSARIALDPEHVLPLGSKVTLHPGKPTERTSTVIVAATAEWPRLPQFHEYALE